MAGAVSQNTYPCIICGDNCNYASLKCDYCSCWLHYRCSELPDYHLLDLMKSNKKFMCKPCCKKKYVDYETRINEINIQKQGLNLDVSHNIEINNDTSPTLNNQNGGNRATLNNEDGENHTVTNNSVLSAPIALNLGSKWSLMGLLGFTLVWVWIGLA